MFAKLNRWAAGLAAAAVVLVLGGCAHPISLAPNVANIAGAGSGGAGKIDKRVGLVITDADKAREVITPGGGGDKVSYFPYRDLEAGLYFALAESFASVTKVSGVADAKVKGDRLNLIITPEIRTTSYSDSILTWPPTLFNIELTCKVVDDSGKAVTELRVVGDGRASFDEFRSDFSLSAKRASDDLLKKLVKALGEAKELR